MIGDSSVRAQMQRVELRTGWNYPGQTCSCFSVTLSGANLVSSVSTSKAHKPGLEFLPSSTPLRQPALGGVSYLHFWAHGQHTGGADLVRFMCAWAMNFCFMHFFCMCVCKFTNATLLHMLVPRRRDRAKPRVGRVE